MALKTPALQEAGGAELTDQESEKFFEKLDEFRETLTDKEQIMLAVMVVEATDDAEAPASDGQAEAEPPTEAELDAFAGKLTEFHDSLEGNQHLLIDTMLGKTWFKHEAEVEGYYWLPEPRRIPNRQWAAYVRACAAAGGKVTWSRSGAGHRNVACWVWK